MFRIFALIFLVAFPLFVQAEASKELSAADEAPAKQAASDDEDTGHSFGHKLLFYIPDRLLDVLDILRLRVRAGPGLAVGVRATKVAQVYVGSYASVYAGLPGPRGRRLPKLPIGLESHNGASASVVDATVDGGIGPDYSSTEFGVSIHPGIVGLDVGIDPVEIIDFLAGILFIDLRDDDL